MLSLQHSTAHGESLLQLQLMLLLLNLLLLLLLGRVLVTQHRVKDAEQLAGQRDRGHRYWGWGRWVVSGSEDRNNTHDHTSAKITNITFTDQLPR